MSAVEDRCARLEAEVARLWDRVGGLSVELARERERTDGVRAEALAETRALRDRLDRIVDGGMGQGRGPAREVVARGDVGAALPAPQVETAGAMQRARMTTRQHAALQLLLLGKSNADIARRLGVSVNTAKVHVRGIAQRLSDVLGRHVSTRAQITAAVATEMDQIDDADYRVASGGLPKDWAATRPLVDCDEYAPLYRRTANGVGRDYGDD